MHRTYPITIDWKSLETLCSKWKILELSFFGSVLRKDFTDSSDIDLLVSFVPDAPWSLWDLTAMREEFESILGRPVDLIEKEALRNPWRREEILGNREIVYAA